MGLGLDMSKYSFGSPSTIDVAQNPDGTYSVPKTQGAEQPWYEDLGGGISAFFGQVLRGTAEEMYRDRFGNPTFQGNPGTNRPSFFQENKYWLIGGAVVFVGILVYLRTRK